MDTPTVSADTTATPSIADVVPPVGTGAVETGTVAGTGVDLGTGSDTMSIETDIEAPSIVAAMAQPLSVIGPADLKTTISASAAS